MKPWLSRLPFWARWLLVVPAAVVSAITAFVAVDLFFQITTSSEKHIMHWFDLSLVEDLTRALLMPYLFVLGGAFLAPTANAKAAYLLAFGVAAWCVLDHQDLDYSMVFVSPIATVILNSVGAIAGAVHVHAKRLFIVVQEPQ